MNSAFGFKGVVLLGVPGAGKGSQSRLLADRFGLGVISTGDLLRKRQQEDVGNLRLKADMNSGQLISDSFVFDLVLAELKKSEYQNGYVLDGVPRTLEQAEMLASHGVAVDVVIYLDASPELVVARILSRRICCTCGAVYNVGEHSICSRCDGALVRREDDTEEVVMGRLNVYREKTELLTTYYERKGVLRRVDGNQPISQVAAAIFDVLGCL
ncbi:MAG: nucleoside monophosphate kinase [Oscillospiraceae bacterium]|jgi:adenylate kinase|nr:nucleoside monophosphate kinase [Oscillospiraceae bacterium]